MKTLAAVVLMGTVGAATGAAQDFSFTRDVPEGTRLAVRNIIGDVRVEGVSGRRVEVTAIKRAGRHGDPDDVEIKAIETDGGVAICVFYPGQRSSSDRDRNDQRRDRSDRSRRARSNADDPCRRDGNWNSNNRNDTRVELTMRVPAGLDLDLKTVAGDLIARGLRGKSIDLATVSGELELIDAQSDALDAATVSGDVTLDRITVRALGAESVSGDVTFTGPIHPKGEYDFHSLSGDVVLNLPGEPDATFRAGTFSGHLESDFPTARDDRRRRNRLSGTWGAGTATIELETFSGDVRIRAAR